MKRMKMFSYYLFLLSFVFGAFALYFGTPFGATTLSSSLTQEGGSVHLAASESDLDAMRDKLISAQGSLLCYLEAQREDIAENLSTMDAASLNTYVLNVQDQAQRSMEIIMEDNGLSFEEFAQAGVDFLDEPIFHQSLAYANAECEISSKLIKDFYSRDTLELLIANALLTKRDGLAKHYELIQFTHKDHIAKTEIIKENAFDYTLNLILSTKAGTQLYKGSFDLSGAYCSDPALPFTDISQHWGRTYIDEARLRCMTSGKSEGIFEPDSALNRAEMAAFITKALILDTSSAEGAPFSDVEEGAWYAKHVTTLKNLGITKGNPDGTYNPRGTLNRAEGLVLIMRAIEEPLDLNIEKDFAEYKASTDLTYAGLRDVPIDSWYAPYVYAAFERGVIEGEDRGGAKFFNPMEPLTRAQLVKILIEALR